MIAKILPYACVFIGSLALTLLLTPLVRELCRFFGMVDKPDPRRINTVPIPRGGGLAIVLGMAISYGTFLAVTGRPGIYGFPQHTFWKMSILAVATALLGLADDRFSLSAWAKLLGQIVIAILVWWWADLGFNDLWPWLPRWIDCVLTVFWIVGAVNAFNLIDGLDGLASGIALIATIGMAGGVFYVRDPASTLIYFVFAGALLGFLRYNYNPASVFLGDCGSMFIGFMLSTLPLVSHESNSLLVSIGMPLLAMGVPIFDTMLAILRRSLRGLLGGTDGNGRLMTADSDHLHHRLLRRVGLNQRKVAWTLYGIAAGAVAVGLVAMSFRSRAGGLWLAAIAVVAVVVFKDATIELFDIGLFLDRVAHTRDPESRRRIAVWSVPFHVIVDILLLIGAYFICISSLGLSDNGHTLRSFLPARVVATFLFLVFLGNYRVVWSRAVGSDFVRLFVACVFGAIAGSVFVYYWPSTDTSLDRAITLAYAMVSFAALAALRIVRGVVRDLFYAIDCSRLKNRKDVSRILVYGAGLRYRTFLRELVRSTSANDRMIVGLLDDDAYLRGKKIGGVRVYGTISDAPKAINELNADTVVIACVITPEMLAAVKRILAPTGVKITMFSFAETPV